MVKWQNGDFHRTWKCVQFTSVVANNLHIDQLRLCITKNSMLRTQFIVLYAINRISHRHSKRIIERSIQMKNFRLVPLYSVWLALFIISSRFIWLLINFSYFRISKNVTKIAMNLSQMFGDILKKCIVQKKFFARWISALSKRNEWRHYGNIGSWNIQICDSQKFAEKAISHTPRPQR